MPAAKDDSATFALLGTDTGVVGPLTFPGFPGVWHVGDEKTAKELGFDTDDEAREALVRANAPVTEMAGDRKKQPPKAIVEEVEQEMKDEQKLADKRNEV
jgi:hypothetical protein